jgi:isopenicillin N synthase-like dioxygenase
MRSIAVGLDLDEMYFEDKINEQQHNLRLLSYPSIKTSLLQKEGQARAGAHSGKAPFLAPQWEGGKAHNVHRLWHYHPPLPRQCRWARG